MIYSSWDVEHNILKLVILGHFLLFYQKRTQKIKILKKLKHCWRYHHYSCVPKITIIWFTVSRYKMRQTELFVILDHFLSFYQYTNIPNNIKNKNCGKMRKKILEILPLYTCVPYIKIIWCMVPEIWSVMDRIFFIILDYFYPFTPLTTWKIKIFKN